MRPLLSVISLLLAVTLSFPLTRTTPVRAQADEVAIEIVDFAFSPATIEIPAGTVVTWTNNDSAPHTVTADDGSFDSGTIESGASFSLPFNEPGTYTYHCEFHPNMTATIVVTEAEEEAEDTPTSEPEETPEPETTPTVPAGPAEIVGAPTDGSNALEYIGRIDQRGATFTVYGYVTYIAGMEPAELFTDPNPTNWSEATARFTYFGSATLTSRAIVDNRLFVVTAEGTAQVYFNPNAGASFDVPESFFSGTAVSESEISIRNALSVVAPDTGVTNGSGAMTFTSATPFDLNGTTYQIGEPDTRLRVSFTGVGVRLEPTEPRAVVAIAASAVPVAPVSAPQTSGAEVTIELGELNDSGISGTATLRETGGATEVTISITGAAGNHPAHIHAGTCDSLDPNPAFPLTSVDAEGSSVTTVDTSLEDLTSEPFAINVHLSPEQIGVYVACGDITAET